MYSKITIANILLITLVARIQQYTSNHRYVTISKIFIIIRRVSAKYFLCLVVENAGTLSYRTCAGVGPNYIRTFDGLEYLFPGRCHYTAFTDSIRSISVKYIDCHRYKLCRKVTSCHAGGKRNVTVWRPSVCPSVPSAYSP